MRTKTAKQKAVLLAAVLAGVGSASASIITVRDFTGVGQPNPGPSHRWNEASSGVMYSAPNAAAKDAALFFEDNETEATGSLQTIRNYKWDLEGFSLSGTTLSVVGSYDFINGETGGLPGTLFIKVGGSAPGFTPLSNPPSGTIANGYGYLYGVNLINGDVYNLTGSTILHTTIYDSFGSNPWKVLNTEVADGNTARTYHSGKTAAEVATITGEANFGLLKGDNGGDGGIGGTASLNKHNIVQIDLGFLGAVSASDEVYFSYTMECGNDSLKGIYGDGFFVATPDGGASLMLLGIGISGLVLAGRRFKLQ